MPKPIEPEKIISGLVNKGFQEEEKRGQNITKQLVDLLECPLSKAQYVTLLRQKGLHL